MSDRRLAGILAAATLLKGMFWIALMPAFKIADEPSHYENIQYRGEYLETPHFVGNEPFGTTIHNGSPADVRLVWQRSNQLFRNRYVSGVRSVHEEQVLREMAQERLDPARERANDVGRLSRLLLRYRRPHLRGIQTHQLPDAHRRGALRVADVRHHGRRRDLLRGTADHELAALAVAAAMFVMLQPMESQMTAAVNNDAGVIGLAAVLFYLQIRFLVGRPRFPTCAGAS